MSATNRGAERVPHDNYATPAWCVHRLLERLSLPVEGRWLEPCAGSGAIIEAVAERLPTVTWNAVELRQECAPALQALERAGRIVSPPMLCDFRQAAQVLGSYEVIFTNPPFTLAREFLEICLPMAKHVVFLLRLNYLASESRATLFRKFPPDVYVLPNRPSFDGTGATDATDYAWFVWGPKRRRRRGKLCVLDPTPLGLRRFSAAPKVARDAAP